MKYASISTLVWSSDTALYISCSCFASTSCVQEKSHFMIWAQNTFLVYIPQYVLQLLTFVSMGVQQKSGAVMQQEFY